MKMRQRKHLVLARLKDKNQWDWRVAPFIKQFHELKAKNERIAALTRCLPRPGQ